jgi:hypothetical protein
VSDYTACYHYNLVDDLELKKIQDSSTEIMKMINTDMAERLKPSTTTLPDVSDFDQGGTNIQSINYAPPNQKMSSKYYSLLLDKELMLRLMDPRGVWRER